MSEENDHVVVRMYDVGFGDAFLLFIPTPQGEKKVLIDCGSIKHGAQPLDKVVEKIIEAVTDENGDARIDLVIGTHRHRDHVSGFDNKDWDEVEVGEVWMPWTEHPTDKDARRIRETQSALALQLTLALERPEVVAAVAAQGYNVDDLRLLALNNLTNEKAMETLHNGFAGSPPRKFLPAKNKKLQKLQAKHVPGVAIWAMGPSREE